jgi:hypothetical protein
LWVPFIFGCCPLSDVFLASLFFQSIVVT